MLNEIIHEFKKPRLYIIIAIGIAIMCFDAYDLGYGTFNPAILFDRATIHKDIIRYNVYNILMSSTFLITTVLPFLVTIPYAYKYKLENARGYNKFIKIRIGLKKYYFQRVIVGGLLGGLTLLMMDVLYYGLLALAFNNTVIPFNLAPHGYFSNVFIHHPQTYLFFMWTEHFLLGFSLAFLTNALCLHIKLKAVAYIVCYVFYVGFDSVCYLLNVRQFAITCNYNPIEKFGKDPFDFALLNIFLLVIGTGLTMIKIKRDKVSNG